MCNSFVLEKCCIVVKKIQYAYLTKNSFGLPCPLVFQPSPHSVPLKLWRVIVAAVDKSEKERILDPLFIVTTRMW